MSDDPYLLQHLHCLPINIELHLQHITQVQINDIKTVVHFKKMLWLSVRHKKNSDLPLVNSDFNIHLYMM